MKKLLLGAISFLVLFSACKDDDNVNSNTTPPEETQLVTPEVRARIADPLNQNPFTGILEIYPCNAETSIYYGNFINECSALTFLRFLVPMPIFILATNESLIKFNLTVKLFLVVLLEGFTYAVRHKPSGFLSNVNILR